MLYTSCAWCLNFHFFCSYSPVQLNNNGILSFSRPVSGYSPETFPLSSNLKVVAPYWADVDTSGTGTVWYRQTTDKQILERAQYDVTKDPTLFPALNLGDFSPSLVFIATWDHVGYYSRRTDKVSEIREVVYTFTPSRVLQLQTHCTMVPYAYRLTHFLYL